MATPSNTVPNTATRNAVNEGPKYRTENNHPSATTSSTSGYITEICSSQQRQCPRNAIQLTIGTFSNQASWLPHCGHRERGRKIDRSCGQRTMHTLRNEP